MTYNILGRRAAQLDTQQPTQMSRQMGFGGFKPPDKPRTLLGHTEDYPDPSVHSDWRNRPAIYGEFGPPGQMRHPMQPPTEGTPRPRKPAPKQEAPRERRPSDRQEYTPYKPSKKKDY